MEAAAGLARKPPQTGCVGVRAECDRVDDRTRLVQGHEGVTLGDSAADVVAVSEHNDYVTSRLARQQAGGEIHCVPEGGARIRSDGERPERIVRIDRGGRERALLRGMPAEGDERDSIRRRLRCHEGSRRSRGLGERPAGHRARRIEREHHVFRPPEIDRAQAHHRASVLEQPWRCGRRHRGDDGAADCRVSAEIDSVQPDACACAVRGREQSEQGDQTERQEHASLPAHWKLPYDALVFPT